MKYILRVFTILLFTLNSHATVHQVAAAMFSYTPSELTIELGDTVVWINTGGTHDVNGNISAITEESFNNPESFSSNTTNEVGATIYTHIFNLAGDYSYDCSVGNHALEGMVGTISVNGGENGTVVDIIVNSDNHTILESAVIQANLVDTLNGSGPFTVFAPTNDAFNALADGTLEGLDVNALTAILLHHVHSGYATAISLTDGMEIPTMNEDILTVSVNETEVMIDMSTVTVTDIIADNGIVHVIDMVLLPSVEDLSIMTIISNSPIHTKLEAAIIAAGLENTLDSAGTFTVFAPVDDAFENLEEELFETLLANTALLSDLLLGHVVDEVFYAENLVNDMMITAMNGNELSVSIDGTTVMISMSNVVEADIIANNGVVHAINMVIIPAVNADTTVWSIIEASPVHKTLETAILAAELNGTLSGEGPFTVFAPTDEAFDALAEGTVDKLLGDIPLLTSILLHHVHPDNALAEDLMDGMQVPTMNDDILVVSTDGNNVMIDMANVIVADTEASNGVIHIVDAVLIPETNPTGLEILNLIKSGEYIYSINLLGEKIERDTKGIILFDVYSNGKTIKRYNLTK